VCLAIPGKIISIDENSQIAVVDFNGLNKKVNINLIQPKIDDYIIVHAGFAIEIIDQKEAEQTLNIFNNSK